ncbi:hypothetical protein ABTP79_18750, partial [Acinetobacter baumannii]
MANLFAYVCLRQQGLTAQAAKQLSSISVKGADDNFWSNLIAFLKHQTSSASLLAASKNKTAQCQAHYFIAVENGFNKRFAEEQEN